ncbi:MAG TPA: N-acetyltransferase, partial [Blastocatellia bacterium]|nr:N-acetyltransferase [Blastocatellia bacterium]
RHYMIMSLPARGGQTIRKRREEQSDILIRPWEDSDFAAAAQAIYRSYRGEHDSRINSQYRTEEGCVELLSILTDHIWCGDFQPKVSRVAIDRRTGDRVGVLIASRIADRAGHIGQISLIPSHQGRGIGRRMIEEALSEFSERGFECVSLAVTASNRNAFHLYQSCGFETIHTFPVFYRERR